MAETLTEELRVNGTTYTLTKDTGYLGEELITLRVNGETGWLFVKTTVSPQFWVLPSSAPGEELTLPPAVIFVLLLWMT